MAKGFALSLDSLFSVFVLAIFVLIFSFISSQAQQDSLSHLVLEKQANDALIVLDKSGNLQTLNSTSINSSINSLIPDYVSWSLKINYYNYSDGFHLFSNSTIGSNYSQIKDLTHVQREFLVFENQAISYYAIAELRLWIE